MRKYKLLDRTPYLLMLGKHLGAFPVTRPQQAEPPVAPGMVSLSHFKSLPLEQQLEMRQEMLTVMQKFAQPKVVNE